MYMYLSTFITRDLPSIEISTSFRTSTSSRRLPSSNISFSISLIFFSFPIFFSSLLFPPTFLPSRSRLLGSHLTHLAAFLHHHSIVDPPTPSASLGLKPTGNRFSPVILPLRLFPFLFSRPFLKLLDNPESEDFVIPFNAVLFSPTLPLTTFSPLQHSS